VLAYNRGSIPEVIEHGTTGIVCEDLSGMMGALESVARIDRAHCRENFDRRFTVQRMVQDYLKVYERQLEGKTLLSNSTSLDPTVESMGVNAALGMRTEELRTEELAVRSEGLEVPN
jgi:hypothetical protein